LTRAPIIAHGIGGRLDLPVPVSYFAAEAAVVLIVSFVALAALWKKPRLQTGPIYDIKSAGSIPTLWLSWLGVLGLGLVVIAGLAALLTGQESTGTRNIAPVLLWVYFWLVVPFAGLVLGNLYTAVNPWRTLGRWLGIGEVERGRPRVGIWPAVIGLVAFAWLELVYPNGSTPGAIAIAALVYTVGQLALMARYGRETSLASFDIFTTYNRLLSSISPWGRTNEGRLAYRGWLRSLPVIPEWNGLAPFLIAMIGTVTFDGISNTTWYEALTGDLGMSVGGKTLLLPLTCAVIGVPITWLARRPPGWGAIRKSLQAQSPPVLPTPWCPSPPPMPLPTISRRSSSRARASSAPAPTPSASVGTWVGAATTRSISSSARSRSGTCK